MGVGVRVGVRMRVDMRGGRRALDGRWATVRVGVRVARRGGGLVLLGLEEADEILELLLELRCARLALTATLARVSGGKTWLAQTVTSKTGDCLAGGTEGMVRLKSNHIQGDMGDGGGEAQEGGACTRGVAGGKGPGWEMGNSLPNKVWEGEKGGVRGYATHYSFHSPLATHTRSSHYAPTLGLDAISASVTIRRRTWGIPRRRGRACLRQGRGCPPGIGGTGLVHVHPLEMCPRLRLTVGIGVHRLHCRLYRV